MVWSEIQNGTLASNTNTPSANTQYYNVISNT